jgi:hypothetical protein
MTKAILQRRKDKAFRACSARFFDHADMLMRILSFVMLLMILPATAQEAEIMAVEDRAIENRVENRPFCLSPYEMREAIAAKAVVAPIAAIRSARLAVPGSEVLRARLCKDHDRHIYRITTLRKDGRLVNVTVDGTSGKVDALP